MRLSNQVVHYERCKHLSTVDLIRSSNGIVHRLGLEHTIWIICWKRKFSHNTHAPNSTADYNPIQWRDIPPINAASRNFYRPTKNINLKEVRQSISCEWVRQLLRNFIAAYCRYWKSCRLYIAELNGVWTELSSYLCSRLLLMNVNHYIGESDLINQTILIYL